MPRAARQTKNQRLFRQVNERIAELSGVLEEPELPQSFFCECGRVGCNAMFDVPLGIYAIVRDNDDLYIVVHGHEETEDEQPVADHGDFLIVRTLRSAPSLAPSTAPRPAGTG